MDSTSFVALISAFLAVVSVFLGVKYRQGLKKGRLFADLLEDIIDAAEDDEVSEDDFQNLVAATKQVAADVDEQTATLRAVSD